MLSLEYRINLSDIITSQEIKSILIPNGRLQYTSERSLILDMDTGGSCGIGDDVHAYAADKLGIWYITYRDYFSGEPWVYYVSLNNKRFKIKGIIDENGSFFFIEGKKLHCIDKFGVENIVCAKNSVNGLLEYDNENLPLTLSRIERYILLSQDYEKIHNIYPNMIDMHRLVDCISNKDDIKSINPAAVARIVIESLKLSSIANINIQREIIKQLKKDLNQRK